MNYEDSNTKHTFRVFLKLDRYNNEHANVPSIHVKHIITVYLMNLLQILFILCGHKNIADCILTRCKRISHHSRSKTFTIASCSLSHSI